MKESITPDKTLDTSGDNCPLPLLKAKKEISQMSRGQILQIIATDPATAKDFNTYTTHTAHSLIESKEAKGKFYILIQKK